MTETPDEALLRKARELAFGLGVTLYIRDGQVYSTGPGHEIVPRAGAHPEVAGRGPIQGESE